MGLYFSLKKDIEQKSNLGYAGFFHLRKELLEQSGVDIDYLGGRRSSDLNNLERAIVNFMYEVDDDGFISNKDCHILYREFKEYKIKENNLDRYKILMNALKQAIDNDMDLTWS